MGLQEKLIVRMQELGGWITFAEYMEICLYAPGLGYYERERVFGREGDYITAADLGPWVAMALADLVASSWRAMGQPSRWSLIEQGGGSGRLLCDLARSLPASIPPPELISVERSEAMRQRQREAYAKAGLRVELRATLEEVGARPCAVFFCNELVDAFPVRRFLWQGGAFIELGVTWSGEAFQWKTADGPMSRPPEIDPEIVHQWAEGYRSEFNPGLRDWIAKVSGLFERGIAIVIDYGYPQFEYYRPERRDGTLMGHRRHEVIADVLAAEPGSCDITAHVDFTALARHAVFAGFRPWLFLPQWAWLAQSPGVQAHLHNAAQRRDINALGAIKRLMLPQGMGESFKLCVLGKEASAPAEYLMPWNRLQRLRVGA